MDEPSQWTLLDKALYAIGFPLLAVVGAVVFFTVVQSGGDAKPQAAAPETPAALAARRLDEERQARREEYQDCMKEKGADFGRGYRGRFSPRPDMNKIREASAVCQSLLRLLDEPPPSEPSRQPTLPIA